MPADQSLFLVKKMSPLFLWSFDYVFSKFEHARIDGVLCPTETVDRHDRYD